MLETSPTAEPARSGSVAGSIFSRRLDLGHFLQAAPFDFLLKIRRVLIYNPHTMTRRFSPAIVSALNTSKIIGVRAGEDHRFTGVWVVMVKDRVFARSWSDKPTGWYRTFVAEPLGTIQIPDGREIRVRAKKVRGERLMEAIESAYGEKYNTKASRKWVVGFRRPRRRLTTIEFVPR